MKQSTKTILIFGLLMLLAFLLPLFYATAVFIQLFLAFALAYILHPSVVFLEGRGLGRISSVLLVFVAFTAIFAAAVMFLIFSVGGELSRIQLNIPGYAQYIHSLIPQGVQSYFGIDSPENLSIKLAQLIQEARSAAPSMLKPLLIVLQKTFSSSIGFVLAILGYAIIPVYLFYLLVDLPKIKAAMITAVPPRFQSIVQDKMSEIDKILSGFIRGQLSVCAILAVLYSVGLYFIGIDLALLIGSVSGIAFIIPYVGTVIGIVLSLIMATLKFQDLLHPLLCVGWFALVQGLEGAVITPKIVGETVGLHPLVALFALLLGGQLFGIMGMLVAVPFSAVLQVFLRSLFAYYRASEFYTGGDA